MRKYLLPLLAALLAAATTTSISLADRGGDGRNRDDDGRGKSAYAIGLWGDLPYSDLQKTTRSQPDRGHERSEAGVLRA